MKSLIYNFDVYESSIGSDLSVVNAEGVVSVALRNPNGDTVATVPVTGSEAGTGISGWAGFDEFGNMLTSGFASTGVNQYGWHGSAQRAVNGSGLILMGVRLYNSVTGSFTSRDPILGGNTTAYVYPQDPINSHDLDGMFLKWLRKK
ncbi:RHS repeat-associated core domain-containing protein [Timonella sp. A28]|uniref:RHS repeat-associated core domain-containing protein n=1 Tax=Timonella sp. A28 TaxID=3442640 RepID=UPI003EB6A0D1